MNKASEGPKKKPRKAKKATGKKKKKRQTGKLQTLSDIPAAGGVTLLAEPPKVIHEGVMPWRERLAEGSADFARSTPPTGDGHFDRYYFSNCSESFDVENVMAHFMGAGPDLFLNDFIEVGETSVAQWLDVPIQPFEAMLTGLVIGLGQQFTYFAQFAIPPENGECIVSVNAGITTWYQEEPGGLMEYLGLFGTATGESGTLYPAHTIGFM